MSHHHDHAHDHSHDHSHDHAHEMPFEEKIKRLLEHWQSHNNDHIDTYRKWAVTCEDEGFSQLKPHFDKIAELTNAIGDEINTALSKIA